jgi:hypothetical protein
MAYDVAARGARNYRKNISFLILFDELFRDIVSIDRVMILIYCIEGAGHSPGVLRRHHGYFKFLVRQDPVVFLAEFPDGFSLVQ